MSDEKQPNSEQAAAPVQLKIPENLGRLVLDPLDHALAAGERQALKVGVPTHQVIEFLLNHLASVVAMIEPPGAREACLTDLVRSFPVMVRKHVDVRYTTAGGIKLPGIG